MIAEIKEITKPNLDEIVNKLADAKIIPNMSKEVKAHLKMNLENGFTPEQMLVLDELLSNINTNQMISKIYWWINEMIQYAPEQETEHKLKLVHSV